MVGRHGRRWIWRIAIMAAFAVAAGLALHSAGVGCRSAPAWQPPEPATSPVRGDLMEGQWTGQWASENAGMDGALQAVIRKQDDGNYHATFDAVFGGIFNHHSEVVLTVSDKADAWRFSGQKDLGFMAGGVYTYSGQTDGREFTCGYDSSMDKGTFRLKRVSSTTAAFTTMPATAPESP